MGWILGKLNFSRLQGGGIRREELFKEQGKVKQGKSSEGFKKRIGTRTPLLGTVGEESITGVLGSKKGKRESRRFP